MVDVLCFVDDAETALKEARRIIRPGGCLLLAMIDRESELGKEYSSRKGDDEFYRDAKLFSTSEAIELLRTSGFADLAFSQSLFTRPTGKPEEPKEGHGEGSFIVIRAQKKALR